MRPINGIIVHCSATPQGRNVTRDEIKLWHLRRGWDDIGYHFVIELNGTVAEGRPVSEVGAHCKGHNDNTIGICYVGGMASNGEHPKDTRTPEQQQALLNLIAILKQEYGPLWVHGHNEFSNKACPSFNVQTELRYPGGKPVAREGATVGAVGAGAGTIGTVLTEASHQLGGLVHYVEAAKWIFIALAVAGVAFTVYSQLKARKTRIVG